MKITFEDVLSRKEWIHSELLNSLPPCRILKYSTKACGSILPNHCYKPFLFVFGLTI